MACSPDQPLKRREAQAVGLGFLVWKLPRLDSNQEPSG